METMMKNVRHATSRKIGWLAVLLSAWMALLYLSTASAQEATPRPPVSDDQVNAIAKQMYCPVCESTPLDVCPTQACIEWRELIRDLLAEGKTEAEIKQYFVDRFGDRVLAAPPARGLNWLVYVIPPIAILAGLLILYSALRSWRQTPSTASPPAGGGPQPASKVDDEYTRRLEEELRKL
jgi:cytochrome c-type biogenesis protein CcmH